VDDEGDGPVGSNSRILYGGNNVESIAVKNDVVESNGKSIVDGMKGYFGFGPERISWWGDINPSMSDTSNVVPTDGCKVSIRRTNSGIKVYFVPTKGGRGPALVGGNFVMCVGGFPSFLLLNEYAANITAKGKGRLGGWKGRGNGSGALSQLVPMKS
jgi:hypothetical protein